MTHVYAILGFFVLPIGATLLLVAIGVVWRLKALCWAGVAILWISSTPLVSDAFVRAIEGWEQRRQPSSAPVSDAIVVLSEGRLLPPGDPEPSEWTDADRFFGGIALYKSNKAPLLIFTGGWSPRQPGMPTEGETLAAFATQMGVPKDSILITAKVSNTKAEANAVAALLKQRPPPSMKSRILLVTSALHMRRALFLFEYAGVKAVPYPVDFKVSAGEVFSMHKLIPSVTSLKVTEAALRELYGFLVYWALVRFD